MPYYHLRLAVKLGNFVKHYPQHYGFHSPRYVLEWGLLKVVD